MKVVVLKNKNVKLVADDGKIVQSKATHIDEETNDIVPDVMGFVIYLGKYDKQENYVEVEMEEDK